MPTVRLSNVWFLFLLLAICRCSRTSPDQVPLYVTDEEARFESDTLSDIPPSDTVIPYDVGPVALRMLKPEYPVIALGKELAGNLALKVWVTSRGTVRRAVILKSPDAVFNKEALRAAMGWYFSPAMRNGKEIECWTTIMMGFRPKRNRGIEVINQ